MTETAKSSVGRLSLGYRLVLAGTGALGLALLITAGMLRPDPRGYGTHEQLGLSKCWFQQTTGHVCPMCGATTAWAYAVRGDVVRAASVHLAGTLLCAAVAISAPWLFASSVAGRWIVGRPALEPVLWAAAIWFLVVVLDWAHHWWLG